ncbi:MAG: glycosyltransferase [Planctomycetota bacterium]
MSEESSSTATYRLLVIGDGRGTTECTTAVFNEVRRIETEDADEFLKSGTDFNTDCIRCNNPGTYADAALKIGASLDVPVVIHVNDTRDVVLDGLSEAGCVVAASEFLAQRCIENGADPARVVTVHAAVDRDLFRPDGESINEEPGSPVLLLISEGCSPGDIKSASAACLKATQQHPNLILVVVGDATVVAGQHVRVLPHCTDEELASWLRWADGLLIPSAHVLSAKHASQALACGTPCIAPNHSALQEVLTDGWDAVLFEEPSQLDDAVRRFAEPSTYRRLSAPARTSSERFDATTIQRRLDGVYTTLLPHDWPLLSVVLPTYNRAHRLETAIRGVLSQDYPNLELIVVNDGSTDTTAETLNKLETELDDDRLHVITRENGGLPTALNTGFAAAKGEFWTWISDDDTHHPGCLRALARELEIDPDTGLVYADMRIVSEDGRERLFQCGPPERLEQHSTLGLCFMYRASVARQVGEYDPDLFLAEDYDYWLRMRKQTTLRWLPRVLFTYADAMDSLTRTRFRAVGDMRLRLLEREFGQRADWSQMKFDHFLHFASLAKQNGAIGASLHNAWGAIRSRPTSGGGWRAMMRALTPRPVLRLTRRLRGMKDD